jgi:hypothetical protein
MNVNCSIDTSLTIGHYVFEASFWLKDWKLSAETHMSSSIKVLQIGPFVFSLTNLKKMKELYENQVEPVSFDELMEL